MTPNDLADILELPCATPDPGTGLSDLLRTHVRSSAAWTALGHILAHHLPDLKADELVTLGNVTPDDLRDPRGWARSVKGQEDREAVAYLLGSICYCKVCNEVWPCSTWEQSERDLGIRWWVQA